MAMRNRQLGQQRAPAPNIDQPDDGQRQEPDHDQEELQHFIVNGRPQSAQKRIDHHDSR